MDHKAFLASLPAETRIALTERRAGPALVRLVLHFGVILGLMVWVAAGWTLWWALIPVLGIFIAFLFNVAHEATHNTLLPDERANDWVGHVAGGMIGLPFLWFRWFHMAHHRHTNDPDDDPELQGAAKPETVAAWVWHVSGLPYWIAEWRMMGRLALGDTSDIFLPHRANEAVVREAQVLVTIYALVAISLLVTPFFFWIWLLPGLIGQMFLRVFLLAEHADCPHVADMFENTRTTLTTRLVRWITWNASYHVEHHVSPNVPFYKLPALHALMKDELKMTSDGYAAFTREFLARRRDGAAVEDA